MVVSGSRGGAGAVMIEGVRITHPDRPLWLAAGSTPAFTKADLARYYVQAAGRLLEHVAQRPLAIVRAPDGVQGEKFFQRNLRKGLGRALKGVDVGDEKPDLMVSDAAGLVALAQIGGVEIHPWGCRPDDPDTPDRITFDLDPGEGVTFEAVIEAAWTVKTFLEALGLAAFAKITGGKGLHVVAPIRVGEGQGADWDQAKAFARAAAEALAAANPRIFTTTLAREARADRIFIDYLRNARAATAVAPWSPRARREGTVAVPLDWPDVRAGLSPLDYTLRTIGSVLAAPDPWRGFSEAQADLGPALRRLEQ